MDLAYTWLAIQALQSPMRTDHDASRTSGRSRRVASAASPLPAPFRQMSRCV